MTGRNRSDIRAGLRVAVVLKEDQRTGYRTEGIVQDILTNSPTHPHGIKVRLESGAVGRVQEILSDPSPRRPAPSIPAPAPDIVALSSREVYRNRWMRVREDAVRRSDGSEGIYGVVEKKDFATVVPLSPEGLTLVEQYRYTVGARFWEFPQGSKEEGAYTPEELARAELEEETGLQAGVIEEIAELFTAYGFSDQRYRVFLATDLAPGTRNLDPEEQDLVSKTFPVAEVERMILSGEIRDAATVAAFGLLRMRGRL